MAELNEPQKYLLPYIDKYQSLVKEIGDSITDYRDGGGISYLITQKEMDWLIFQFYPSLQNNLEKFLPYERAKDIQQTTKKAFHKVLSYLSDRAGYEKYRDGSVASQDMEILMDAYNAAGDILAAPKHKIEKESADPKKGQGKMTIRQTFLEDIAEQVEDLLVEYPKAKQLFNNKAKIFKTLFDKWKLAEDNLLQPYLDPSGNNGRDGYKYDKDDRIWFPVQAQKNLLPNPALWEIEDKLCCHYVTLGIIRDMFYADKAKPVVKDILRGKDIKTDAFSLASYLIEKDNDNRRVYSDESIKLALSQVKQDLAKTASDNAAQEKPNKEERLTMSGLSESKKNWESIENEFGISKKGFGKKIKFVSDKFKRKIIFRDVEHSFVLASSGFAKPAVILAGGVIEELLRLYLEHKSIKPASDNFDGYIKTCETERFLKKGTSSLSNSVRHFRNLVHIAEEKTERHTISKSTAKSAVASIFTIANDF